MFGPVALGDSESAKRRYLAQFVHVGCGGAPVAYLEGKLACTACRKLWPVLDKETLGKTIERLSKDFRSLL